MSTRRAVQISRPGSHSQLQSVLLPEERRNPGDVLIQVAAAGINYADCIIRMGLYASAKELHGYPIVPGFEVAGTVLASDDEQNFPVGRAVLALTLFGGYAERIALPADRVYPVPGGITLQQAAALPAVFLTARYALHEQAHVQSGDSVLVHSAAGGVGGALVQLARRAGARVCGVVGKADKCATAMAAGCEHVIDKSSVGWSDAARAFAPDGFDVVLDANGVETLRDSYCLLAPGGRLVIYGFHTMLPRDGRVNWLSLAWHWLRTPSFNPLDMTRDNRSVLACNLSFLSAKSALLRRGMLELLEAFASGNLTPPPVTPYPHTEVISAHRALESGGTVGKLVLTFDQPNTQGPPPEDQVDGRKNQHRQ